MIDFILHISEHLENLVNSYGTWVYLILFLIVFCETGLVVTPFLPGDSLIFTAGSLAGLGIMDIKILLVILLLAGISGDTVNYAIGKYIGHELFKNKDSKIFRQDYLIRTQNFYQKYGGRTIILARFVPIIRTFAPFVAGMGQMCYKKFIIFNIVGALLWCCLFLFLGYFLGQTEFVKKHLSFILIGIIVVSVLPILFEIIRVKLQKQDV